MKPSEIKIGMPVTKSGEAQYFRVIAVDGDWAICMPMTKTSSKSKKFAVSDLKRANLGPIYPVF